MSTEQFARRIDQILRRLDELEAQSKINYSKGAYTPTYVGGTAAGVTTYTFQNAAWTQIGNQITVRGQVAWSAATGTGNARISLPFAPVGGNFTGSLYVTAITFANNTPQMLVNAGNSYFEMGSPLTNANPTMVAVEAAGNLIFTVTYFLS